MQYPDHLKPEEHLLRITYVGSLSAAEPMEEFATWCITGVAAILALVVANLESVSKIISASGLRWGIVFLTISMLAGVVAKQFGIAIRKCVALLEALYAEFASPQGKAIFAAMTASPEEIQKNVAEPFLWPLKKIMLKAAKKGASDYLSSEKRCIKMLGVMLYVAYLQSIAAAVGILILAFGIK